jgi:hypothetical protein
MWMKDFVYVEPSTLEEVVEFLEQHGEESKILAGGCSLVLLMKHGFVTPDYVVGIRNIPGLNSVEHENGHLRIGAMVTHRVIELSEEIKAFQPMPPEMPASIGQVQVRNLGTIGGNICHGEYRADPPAAMVALDAKVELSSTREVRTVAVEDFISDYYTTDKQSDEYSPTFSAGLLNGTADFASQSYPFLFTVFSVFVALHHGATGLYSHSYHFAVKHYTIAQWNLTILRIVSAFSMMVFRIRSKACSSASMVDHMQFRR